VTCGKSETTVTDIWKNKYKLISFSIGFNLASVIQKQKVMKPSIYEDLNKAQLQWLNHRSEGTLVSRIFPCCTGSILYALGMEGQFNGSLVLLV
jgi:hypothetical protein